jgi:histidyl-tRNA synthetase
VRELLDDVGVSYEIDPTLVRGLDYYTRTVFEFESAALGAQSGVGGGGRYDRLIEQIGGGSTPACGFAAGVERMLMAAGESEAEPQPIDLFVAVAAPEVSSDAWKLSRDARRAGLRSQSELAGRSLKGQLRHADRIGARYTAIVGDEGQVSLRDMGTGEQREVALSEVIGAIT